MHGGLAAVSSDGALQGEAGVFAAFDRRLLTDSPTPIAVGFSGGGDSLALMRLAASWAAYARRPLLALTVDHGLSPDAVAWTAFAAARARESRAAFQALAWTGDKPATGLPAAARAARHALLAKAARAAGASVVLLGHNADDVAETDRMRAGDARGIGRLREWSPSPAWPEGRGVMLLRPMLRVGRADLRAWLAARAEIWIDDPANADPRFARARARAEGNLAAEPAPSVSEPAVAALARLCEAGADGALTLPLDALSAAPRDAVLHILSVATLCAGGGATPPRRPSVEALLANLIALDPAATTLCGARIEQRGEAIRFTREAGDRARNPRPDADGVVDGRFDAGAGYLAFARFRAACFLVEREDETAPPALFDRLPQPRALA